MFAIQNIEDVAWTISKDIDEFIVFFYNSNLDVKDE